MSQHSSKFIIRAAVFMLMALSVAMVVRADTIPLQAVMTASRTVTLTWQAAPDAQTSVFRLYPGDAVSTQIGITTESSFVDHMHRSVCGDTVRYEIVCTLAGGADSGYAAVEVHDPDPTAVAEWGVVSVDEATQTIVLDWEPSADTDIMGYVIYEGTPTLPVDTVYGRLNTHCVMSQFSIDAVHHFKIIAFDSCLQASYLTDVCNNMVLHLNSEPCSRTVSAAWNGYNNMPTGVARYEVWCSFDGSDYQMVAQDNGATTATFNVDGTTMSVKAVVKAVSSSGTIVALSNRVEYTFSTSERPAYLYLRKVSVSDAGTEVTVVGQTDPAFGGNDYSVYRSVDGSEASVVAHVSPDSDGTLVWHDMNAHPKSERLTYWFGVYDGCGSNELKSQQGTTLMPVIDFDEGVTVVRWNGYEGWTGTTRYSLLRSPLSMEQWQSIGMTMATEMRDASVDVSEGAVRYKVVATEGVDSQWGRGDSLQSAYVFHEPQINVWVPNFFTPREALNNRFKAHAVYINPEGYMLVVYNRSGLQVFVSRDPSQEWDGKYKGEYVPEGVYVYRLFYHQINGKVQTKTGTVTVLY